MGGPGGSFLLLLGVVRRVKMATPRQRKREMKMTHRESMGETKGYSCFMPVGSNSSHSGVRRFVLMT